MILLKLKSPEDISGLKLSLEEMDENKVKFLSVCKMFMIKVIRMVVTSTSLCLNLNDSLENTKTCCDI